MPLVLVVDHVHAVAQVRGQAHVAIPALAQAAGWAAGGIGIVTGWPQVWRLWVGRRHEGLSLSSNVLGVLYATAWLLYGVAEHSFVQEVTCVLGLAVIVAILVGHLRLTRPSLDEWVPLLLAGWAVLGLMFWVGARPLGLTASASTIIGIAPQVWLLARRSARTDASGVSRPRWVMSCAANLLWVSYGALVHDPVIVGNSAIIAVFGAAIVYLAADRDVVIPTDAPEPEYAFAA